MNVWIFFVCIGVTALTSFAAGWKVDAWKQDAERLREVDAANKAAQREREFTNFVSGRLEKKIANLKVTNTTVNQEVRHEVEKPVYIDPNCMLPQSGISLRNAAIRAANGTAGESAATMPTPSGDTAREALGLGRLPRVGH